MTLEAEDTAMIRALDLRLLRAAVDASGEATLIILANLDVMGPLVEYANLAFTLTSGYESLEVLRRSPQFLQ